MAKRFCVLAAAVVFVLSAASSDSRCADSGVLREPSNVVIEVSSSRSGLSATGKFPGGSVTIERNADKSSMRLEGQSADQALLGPGQDQRGVLLEDAVAHAVEAR